MGAGELWAPAVGAPITLDLWVCAMQSLLGDVVLRERKKGSLSGA